MVNDMGDAIRAQQLAKVYGNKVNALRSVSLSVRQGEIFTLLGPNGAGKTTFLRIVCTQLMPTSGDAFIHANSVVREPEKVRNDIAMVPQDVIAYGTMTPWDYAFYFAWLRGMDRPKAKKFAKKGLEEVALWNLRHRPCITLSGGEKRRALIAAALASEASVFMLDEPTSGLDAIGRRSVWAGLRSMAAKGKTILLTTHMMEEAEMVSDRLAIIHDGMLIAQGTPHEIKKSIPHTYRVLAPRKALDLSRYTDVAEIGDRIVVYLKSDEEALEMVRDLLNNGFHAEASPVTLEDAFVRLVGRVK
jgi:ABC-2 type transport system ATP-binding protein